MKRLLLILLFVCSNTWAAGTVGLNYQTYRGTGAYPNYNTLTYPTVLSSGISSAINYNWGSGAVLNSGRVDQVMVHWTGYIQWPGTSGSTTVTFYNSSDDGFLLKVNNTTVINNWVEQGNAYYNSSGSITLTAGQAYYIDIWYYENGGGAVAQMYWTYTGQGIQIVPSTNLATDSTYWAPTLCCGGSSANFSASPTNVNKITSFANRGSADSQVYIEQIGNDNTITVQQTGTKDNYTKYIGDGSFNNISITESSTTPSAKNYTELNVTGDSNTVTINQSSTGGTKGIFATVADDNNSVTLTQSGSGNHYLNLNLSGGNKTVDVTQSGSASHMADINLSGAGARSLNLTQQGSTQQFYSISSTCSSNCQTITVNQGQ